MLIENPDIAPITLAAAEDPERLSGVDRLRYLAHQHQFFDSCELAWGYRSEGALGRKLWREWDDWFAGRAGDLPTLAWTENRQNFSGDFRDHIDRRLRFDGDNIPGDAK